MPLRASPGKRILALKRGGQAGTRLAEELAAGRLVVHRRRDQRRDAPQVCMVNIGALGEQGSDHARVAALTGDPERREAILVGQLEGGIGSEQELDAALLAIEGSRPERGAALDRVSPVDDSHRVVCLQLVLDRLRDAIGRGEVEERAKVLARDLRSRLALAARVTRQHNPQEARGALADDHPGAPIDGYVTGPDDHDAPVCANRHRPPVRNVVVVLRLQIAESHPAAAGLAL